MRIALTIVVCMLAGACQARREPETATLRELPAPQPFTETVPGSTVTFTMRPLPLFGWIAETETTWDAFDVFYLRLDEVAAGGDVAAAGGEGPDAITRPTQPYSPPDLGWGHSGYPAIGVSFQAAQKYCEWLTQKTGRRYRLPTVFEWWIAAVDVNLELQPRKDHFSTEYCWFADNAGEQTHPVAKLRASDKGLYDMFGNVAEWCVSEDGTPVVCGWSFRDRIADIEKNGKPMSGTRQTRDWQANDPSFPKSKWWLRDAPFVGFRVVCEERPK